MSADHVSSSEFEHARQALSRFVMEQAEKAAGDLGFGWIPDPDAPNVYTDLCDAFQRSRAVGVPLPVSSLHNDAVIYTTPEVNLAMRFWHDVNHVQQRLTFNLVEELELALWHLGVLSAEGFDENSTAWKLLHADLVGQVYYMGITRQFPDDQRRFAGGCIDLGFDRGLLAEARRNGS
jgi:hypothetical protein